MTYLRSSVRSQLELYDSTVQKITEDERKAMEKKPQDYVFKPVNKMLNGLEHLLDTSKGLKVSNEESAQEGYDLFIGWGTPPWAAVEGGDKRVFLCCMPRFFAFGCQCMCCCCGCCWWLLKCVCCFCCFRACRKRQEEGGAGSSERENESEPYSTYNRFGCCSCLQPAMRYPKKVRFGFFWFKIMSKLHERLIQGLIFTTLFGAFYTWRVFLVVRFGCPHDIFFGSFWACLFQEIKRSLLMIALLCNLPANVLCLVRIRQLDAVIKIMEDIRKLQGLRGIVQDFSRTLEADYKRQSLTDAVEHRFASRMKTIDNYRKHLYTQILPKFKKEPDRAKVIARDATGELIKFLVFTSDTLKPVTEWLDMPPEEQQKRIEKIKAVAKELNNENFKQKVVPELQRRYDPWLEGREVNYVEMSRTLKDEDLDDGHFREHWHTLKKAHKRHNSFAVPVDSEADHPGASVDGRPVEASGAAGSEPPTPRTQEEKRVLTPPMKPQRAPSTNAQPLLLEGASSSSQPR